MVNLFASADHAQRAARHRGPWLRLIIVFAVLLIGDLVSKHYAFEHVAGQPVTIERDDAGNLRPLPMHDAINVVPWILSFKLTLNEGAVFGVGQGGRWVFIAFTVIAATVVLNFFIRSHRRAVFLHVCFAAILAGGMGNLYDRLRFGAVRDLLYLFPDVKLPFGWTWPGGGDTLHPWLFNVADACLVCGLAILILMLLREEWRLSRQARTARSDSSAVAPTSRKNPSS
jgi:signal peptidase II